jgi:CheY-like chemotaxis protein
VRQIVMNLITNASDAIGARSGVITIRTGVTEIDSRSRDDYVGGVPPDGTFVFLEVSDTGCGMDQDTQHNIFDPFFTTKFTGRGLGLAAVLGIVRGHHGAISVTSAVGKGTTFRVLFLPRAEGTVPLAEAAENAGGSVWQGTGTVLFVDDEESVRTVVKAMLESAGFTVLLAADGAEGVSVFREHADAIRVVLLDMTMPRMGGDEAFGEMRAIRPEVPVVLCSGYTEQDALDRFALEGFAGFLQKPFQIDTLLEKITSVVGA